MGQPIYLVEDDVSIRELIGYALKTTGFEYLGFETGKEFFDTLNDDTPMPSLVLLDIMLPNDNGLDILKKLKENDKTADIPVMMLTAKGSEIDKVCALDAGADDYVTKPFGVMELLSRVKALLRRSGVEQKQETQTLAAGGVFIDLLRHEVKANNIEVNLTFKEFELLCYLIRNNGIVLSREKIMEKVWGFDFEGESRTVDMHIKFIRQKLNECGENIKTVRGVGYKFSPSDTSETNTNQLL